MTSSRYHVLTALQHRAASLLGVDEGRRIETVLTMLSNNQRRAPGYWIQLVLAMGIATLGLVLSSTAVVIGAMLVSPLMGPIVELGMGFAVGSSFLVFRAALRVLLSIVVVIIGAALMTVLLPFHEVTSEIAARAAPTALDLLVAIFCALTAAYTAVRNTSDTTSAAAGTAIGIALVPPLCVTGFGLGTGLPAIAGGAALLFTANLSAIFVFSIAAFLILGYNQVDAASVEQQLGVADSTRTDVLAARGQAALQRAFGSRYGVAMRFLIPLVFLGAVYIPLRRALNEVTWEVRARDAIRRIVSAAAPRAVQSSITVERHTIALHLLIVSSADHVADLERSIRQRIESSTGVPPEVTITAVPDVTALAAAARAASPNPTAEPIDFSRMRERVAAALTDAWPSVAGALIDWQVVVGPDVQPTIVTYHLGDSLGIAGRALLATTISSRLGATIAIVDSSIAPTSVTFPLGAESRWMADVQRRLAWVQRATDTGACVRGPVASSRRPSDAQRRLIDAVSAAAKVARGRVAMRDSSGWRVTLIPGPCTDTTAVSTRSVNQD